MNARLAVFAGALCVAAAMQYFWVAGVLQRLPVGYVSETSYGATCRFHLTPTAAADEYDLVVHRRDVTLTSTATHSVIQGGTRWSTPRGVVAFETLDVYGVDRQTRANLARYGSTERHGQYLFPPHTEQLTYVLWDPFYAGPRTATYHHSEQLDGLTVYVFNLVAEDLDQTAGYVSLPDVPEKYRASTDGHGTVWVEPVSGVVVDFTDTGRSYFVEKSSGRRVGEIFQWTDRYTPETRTAQLRLAKQQRLTYLTLEYGLPVAFLLAAVGVALLGRYRRVTKEAERSREMAVA